MGKTSGSKQINSAASDEFAVARNALTPVLPCKKGKTLLKVHLRRLDTDAAVPHESISAAKGSSAGTTKATAAGTGIADFGEVDPGSYSFSVALSPGNSSKFRPYTAKRADVPKQVDFHATLKIAPVHKLRIVVFDKAGAAVRGATWSLTEPAAFAASGTTGGNGLIEAEIPWNETDAKLTVKLPDRGAKEPAPAAAPAVDANNPAYPLGINEASFLPKEVKAKPALVDFVVTITVQLLSDADDEDGWKARLGNVGFPCTDDKRTTRSVKAFQRLQKKEYAGSGKIADISADLKTLHDTV